MEQVWLALLSLLTLGIGGWLTLLKMRESNNIAALKQRVTELEEGDREKEELIAALKHTCNELQRQNLLMKNERGELLRLLSQYHQAGQESLIVVDEKGTIVDWDAAATLMFGYAADEAIGKDVSGLIVPPELRQLHRYRLSQTYLNRRPPRTGPLKTKALCKLGQTIDVEIQLLPGWETGGEEPGWRYGARIKKLILPSPEAQSSDIIPALKDKEKPQ